MINLIPPQYRLLASLAALAVALAGSAAAGAVINGWRLDGDHQRALAENKKEYDGLADQVREQNRAVDALAAASKTADQRRQVAETYTASIIAGLDRRSAAVAGSKAADCDGVLREAWGKWQ
ncbi:MAG: hypothetical protein WA191_20720 [Telluria sp.]